MSAEKWVFLALVDFLVYDKNHIFTILPLDINWNRMRNRLQSVPKLLFGEKHRFPFLTLNNMSSKICMHIIILFNFFWNTHIRYTKKLRISITYWSGYKDQKWCFVKIANCWFHSIVYASNFFKKCMKFYIQIYICVNCFQSTNTYVHNVRDSDIH